MLLIKMSWDSSATSTLTHSFQTVQVVVQRPEVLPGVVTAVCSTHQELQNQADIDQSNLVIWRKIPLKHTSYILCFNNLQRFELCEY